jgi:polyisoprenoid-binding protein YceI
MKTRSIWILFTALMILASPTQAANYVIDTKGAHAFVQFRIQHLGYSWLYGRFDDFKGSFTFDEKNPEAATVNVTINVNSINTNHAERDKHLRGSDFFEVKKFPEARFVSTSMKRTGEQTGIMKGKLTLKDVTREVEIPVTYIGGGQDPWGGYRVGFEGTTTIKLSDYNITYNLGPASQHAEIFLSIEGIRQ